jgi:hypothetical protein
VGLLLLTLAARADVIYGPGLNRVEAGKGYQQAQALAEQMGVELADGMPLYKPANAQPLNACMVVHPQCEVGIDRDDIYPVSEKGLIPEITDYLDRWIDDIQSASGGTIRFVADPNDADVLVSARQRFRLYGEYSGGGMSAEGYACTVQLTARQLSDKDNRVSLTLTSRPQDTVALRGNGRFWKTAPKLSGSDELDAFVGNIMTWYGYGARTGSKGAGVRRIQQSMIRRYFLGGKADGSFGPRTEAALKSLQEAYSLEKTGVVDGKTLIAVYYDHAAVDDVR